MLGFMAPSSAGDVHLEVCLSEQVLQSFWLRSTAGKMAYYDKQRFANDDAVRVGRIHTFVPGRSFLALERRSLIAPEGYRCIGTLHCPGHLDMSTGL